MTDFTALGRQVIDTKTLGPQVQVGDRVSWHASPELVGTIARILLGDHPFYVLWDNGRDDWYKGEWLVLVERPLLLGALSHTVYMN